MTATRWAMCSTMARSWLMNSRARPSSRCRSCSRLTICALTETSSAETASSQTMSSGSSGQGAGDADALALAARELVRPAAAPHRAAGAPCRAARRPAPRSPPASWPGPKLRMRLGQDVAHAHARIEARERVLEHHLHRAAQRPHLARGQRSSMRLPSSTTSPAVVSNSRRIALPTVDLPHPDSPTSASVSPFADRERLMPSTACTWPVTRAEQSAWRWRSAS